MKVSEKFFLDLCDAIHPSYAKAYKEAFDLKFHFETMERFEEMNSAKGLAPSSATIVHRLCNDNENRPPPSQSYIPMNSWVSIPRAFVRNWRQRFGGKFGRVRIVPNLTAESMFAAKVSA